MDKNTLESLSKIDIPDIAKGTVLPDSILMQQINEAKEKDAIRKQRKHDFAVATYSAVIAAIVSALISCLFQALQ